MSFQATLIWFEEALLRKNNIKASLLLAQFVDGRSLMKQLKVRVVRALKHLLQAKGDINIG